MAKIFSIIIPVYNDSEDLKLVLDAINRQDFPAENVETFVVDNGSSDDSIEVAKGFSFVNVLLEHEYLNSPYSCRNRGIEKANGDIIVLLDASCKPVGNWLNAAHDCYNKTDAEIIGGDVKFDFKGKVTAGKVYDSITNIKMQESIEGKGVAKTANLFIRKEIFEKVGVFPEGLRSGGDVRWTAKASKQGYKLQFCKNAIVYKTARSILELLKKQWRVGSHQPIIKNALGERNNLLRKMVRVFVPINPIAINSMIKKNDLSIGFINIILVSSIGQLMKLVMLFSNLYGLLKLRINKYL